MMIRHGVNRSIVATKGPGGGLPTPSFVLRICPPAFFSVSQHKQPQRQEFHVSRSGYSNGGDNPSQGVDVDFYRTQLKERKTAFTSQQLTNDETPPPRGTMTRTSRGFQKSSAEPRGSASSKRPSNQHPSHRTPYRGNKGRKFSLVDTTQKDYATTLTKGSLNRRSSVATIPSSREHTAFHRRLDRGSKIRMFRAVDKTQKHKVRTHRKESSCRSNAVNASSNRQRAAFQTTPARRNKARTRRAVEHTQKDSPSAQKSKRHSTARSITKPSHDEYAPLSNNSGPTAPPSSWPSTTLNLFISCLPGLEPILAAELTALGGFSHKTPNTKHGGGGGILTEAQSFTKLMECHLWLGTASHILLRCGEPFSARGWPELHRKLVRMPWQLVLQPHVQLDVRVTSSKSKLYHTEAIAQRVSEAIYESLGHPGNDNDAITETTDEDEEQPQISKNSDENTVRLLVRVHRDMFQISIDTSLTPLHQRGYRFETAKAPLREDLAFALLHAVGWTPQSHRSQLETTSSNPYNALLDPFCGSGTIAIEGAAMLAGLPPGRLRPPPLAGTQLYDPSGWKKLKDSCSPLITDAANAVLVAASDRDAGGVDAARSNAERAGVLERIDFSVSALTSHPWWDHPQDDETSLLVATNPPYGKRISSRKKRDGLLPLYQALGQRILAQQGAGAAILVKNVNLARKTGLPVKAAFTARHGGISVSAMVTN